MSERRSLTDQALFLLAGRFFSFALTFALPLIVARMFSKYDFGLYRKFSVFSLALFILAQFGLTYSLPSLIPRYPQNISSLLTNTVLFQGLICLFLLILGGLTHVFGLLLELPPDFVKVVLPLAAFAGFMVVSSPYEQILVIEERGQAAAVLTVAFESTRGTFLLLAALLFHNIIVVLWAIAAAALLRYIAMLVYLRRKYGIGLQYRSPSIFAEQWKLAGPMSIQSGAHLLEAHIDKYLIIYFYSTSTYAMYSVGAFQIPVVEMLFYSIASVILPRLATYYHDNHMEQLLALWNEAIRKSAIVLFPLFAWLWTIHREFLMVLFSEKYLESVPIFAVYVWIIPTYIVANNLLLQAIGHSKYLFWTGIYKPILAVLMVYGGLMWGGLLGAAAGLVLYQYIATLLYTILSARALRVSIAQILPLRALLHISLLMTLACLVTLGTTAWIEHIWLRHISFSMPFFRYFTFLSLKSVLFLGMAGFLLYYSSVLTPEDRSKIQSLLRRILSKLRIIRGT